LFDDITLTPDSTDCVSDSVSVVDMLLLGSLSEMSLRLGLVYVLESNVSLWRWFPLLVMEGFTGAGLFKFHFFKILVISSSIISGFEMLETITTNEFNNPALNQIHIINLGNQMPLQHVHKTCT
jgi:hypothetical protein